MLCTLIQNIFFGHFDTLKNLNIPKEYKFITRSEKDYFSTLLDGGQVTLSKTEFIEKTEENFDHSFEGLENSFIKTIVKLNGDKDISIYNLHLAPTFGVGTNREETEYGKSFTDKLKEKIYSAASDSRSLRVKQIDELLDHIDSKNIHLVLGDFNICKFIDKEEFNELVEKMKTKGLVYIKISSNNLKDELVINGTYKKLNPKSMNENYFEYLDHAFVSKSHENKFEAIFEEYVNNIDHKPCKIMYRK